MERRDYPRINISADGVFILKSQETMQHEFSACVSDISESGFKITLDKSDNSSILYKLNVDDMLGFNIVDSYDLFGEEVDTILDGTAIIKRRINTNDSIILGCRFYNPSEELITYVTNKKTASFMSSLKNRQYLKY